MAKRVLSKDSSGILPVQIGTGCYLISELSPPVNLQLDATCKTYLALINSTAYSPANGEKITVILKGNL